jgi:hypothetical protein
LKSRERPRTSTFLRKNLFFSPTMIVWLNLPDDMSLILYSAKEGERTIRENCGKDTFGSGD